MDSKASQALKNECKVILDEPIGKDAIAMAIKNKPQHHRAVNWCITEKDNPEFT